MPNIFTRKAVGEIMGNEALTPEQRTEQVFSLYGRALDDGYIARSAAEQARQAALEQARTEWESSIKAPDPRESEEYKTLQGQFDAYRQMQGARTSEDFRDVKPKFFETVYGMVNRADGAKPVKEQLDGIRKEFEEYFQPQKEQGGGRPPRFGAPTEGGLPRGETGAVKGFADAWGFGPKKN